MNVISKHVSWAIIRIKGTGLWIHKLTDGSIIGCSQTQSKGIKATLYVQKITYLSIDYTRSLYLNSCSLYKLMIVEQKLHCWYSQLQNWFLLRACFVTTNNKAWWHINLVSYDNYYGLPPQFCPLIFNNLERNFQKSDRHGIIGAVKTQYTHIVGAKMVIIMSEWLCFDDLDHNDKVMIMLHTALLATQ